MSREDLTPLSLVTGQGASERDDSGAVDWGLEIQPDEDATVYALIPATPVASTLPGLEVTAAGNTLDVAQRPADQADSLVRPTPIWQAYKF